MSEAEASKLSGVLLVRGFVAVDRKGRVRLCDRLGGSPPVCQGATLVVTSMRMHSGRPVLGLAGVASIDEAEVLAGLELRAEAGLGPLPDGEYYHRDLIGCAVVTDTGETVGQVTGVEGERQVSRLVVRGSRGDVLIPLADEICAVDVRARRITVRPPAGLLELNGDWR